MDLGIWRRSLGPYSLLPTCDMFRAISTEGAPFASRPTPFSYKGESLHHARPLAAGPIDSRNTPGGFARRDPPALSRTQRNTKARCATRRSRLASRFSHCPGFARCTIRGKRWNEPDQSDVADYFGGIPTIPERYISVDVQRGAPPATSGLNGLFSRLLIESSRRVECASITSPTMPGKT